jgi:Protein of unknown function (DUF2905)
MEQSGKVIILIGLSVVLIGLAVYAFGEKLSWLGHLPGDFKIERENLKIYFPLTTMIILSLFLNIAFRIIKWILQ